MKVFQRLLNKITDSREYIWLAKFHIVAVMLGIVGLLTSILILLIMKGSGVESALLGVIGEMSLLFGFELSVLGFGALAARAILVREVSFVSGHLDNPKFFYDGRALFVGIFLAAVCLISQILITFLIADILTLY